MTSLASRRLRNAAWTLAGLAGVALWVDARSNALRHATFDTGYLLLATLLVLALYHLRKKLPAPPLGSSAAWLQVHLYVAFGSVGVFGMHIGWRLPGGVFETCLAVLYLAVVVSGLVGLYWTRTLPPKLARVGEEVVYERIAMLRQQLRDRAHAAMLEAARSAVADTLGQFYSQRLLPFFEKQRTLGYFLRPSSRLRKQLLAELTEAQRYFSEPEQEASEQLFALIRQRDDLDFQAALQWRLKAWLFLHIGLTYPLLATSMVHGLLAHLFDGAVP